MAKVMNPTKVVTGKVRMSYVTILDPKVPMGGGKPKYSMSVIIRKSDKATVEKIKNAVAAAYENDKAKLKGTGKSVPALELLKTPLRDGDMERPDDPDYAGCYFLNANSTTKPGIVDANCQPIIERSEIYSGIYGRVSPSFYGYNVNGNRGIACGLQNVQKLADGEHMGGHTSAESDFGSAEDDDFLG